MRTSTLVDFAIFILVGGRALQLAAVLFPGSPATSPIARFRVRGLFSGWLSGGASIALAVLRVSTATRSRGAAGRRSHHRSASPSRRPGSLVTGTRQRRRRGTVSAKSSPSSGTLLFRWHSDWFRV